MTIKQQGGIFGRNPAFNTVEANSIGIGTGTPSEALEIRAAIPTLRLTDSDNNAFSNFRHNFGSLVIDVDPIEAGSSSKFTVKTDNVTKMEIGTTGDLTVSTGNLVIGTSGKGIDFSATSGTGTSELFDDYEEGTWTSTVGGTATYGVNTARYTKIGRQVFATFDLNITTIGTGNTKEISGLPFTCGDDIAEGVSISFYDGLATNVVELNAYVFGTTIRFRSSASAGSGLTDLAVLGDGCRVTGTAIYTTDS